VPSRGHARPDPGQGGAAAAARRWTPVDKAIAMTCFVHDLPEDTDPAPGPDDGDAGWALRIADTLSDYAALDPEFASTMGAVTW
jgi:hypothetical protein